MSPYFVKSFKNRNNNSVWEYATVGECYKSGINTKKLNDFLCDPNTEINSVQRNENQPVNGQALPTGPLFSIGSVLKNGAHQKKITRIKIDQGLVLFEAVSTVNGDRVVDTTLANTTLFVAEPVVAPAVVNANKIAEIEAKIKAANPRPLRIRGVLRNRNGQTLQDFVLQFITEWNNPNEARWNNANVADKSVKDTLYADTDDIQTAQGKRRSIGDLFMIVRYYYPACTLKELLKLVYVTLAPKIGSCNCRTIRKRVWYYEKAESASVYQQSNENDEYGVSKAEYINLLR